MLVKHGLKLLKLGPQRTSDRRSPDLRAERGPHPCHRRAQVAQSSVRVPSYCAHHLADVRGRYRQERRAPRPVETLSSTAGRHGAFVVVVHRTGDRQPVERRPLSNVSPSCSRATGCWWSWTSSPAASSDPECTAVRSTGPASVACSMPPLGMSRALLKLSGSLVHDYATISDDSPSPNRASRARRAATSAGIS